MKLSAGLLTCVAAGPTVTCNKGDAAVMTAKLLDADVQIDLTTVGWTKVSGGYEKEYVPTAGDAEEVVLYKDDTNHSLGTYRALQIVNSVDSNGCETETVGGVTVCVKTGHEYTFTCNYDLSDQDLTEQPFTVSGSDTVDSATGNGSLTYTLSVDKTAAYTIGDTVTATITPATSGLVYATITSCEVRNTSESEKGVKRQFPLAQEPGPSDFHGLHSNGVRRRPLAVLIRPMRIKSFIAQSPCPENQNELSSLSSQRRQQHAMNIQGATHHE